MNKLLSLLGVLLLSVWASFAEAQTRVADANSSSHGTDLSSSFTGVTLADAAGGSVYASSSSIATYWRLGSLVLTRQSEVGGTGLSWSGMTNPAPSTIASVTSPHVLKVTFDAATDYVSVVVMPSGDDPAIVALYNSSGNLLTSDISEGSNPDTLTFTRGSNDTKTVLIGGLGGNRIAVKSIVYNDRSGSQSVLEIAANSLSGGEWTTITPASGWTLCLGSGGSSDTSMTYSNELTWDSVRHKLHYVGSDHEQPVDSSPLYHIIYDEATDTCSKTEVAWSGGTQHQYDHAAYDPKTGDLFVRHIGPPSGARVDYWDGSSWTQNYLTISHPYTANTGAALEWWPDLDGMIYCSVVSGLTTGGVSLWRRSTGSWTTLSSSLAGVGGEHNTAFYLNRRGSMVCVVVVVKAAVVRRTGSG